MRKRRYQQDRTQRVLELEHPRPADVLEKDPSGLVEVLAALMLEAIGAGGRRGLGGGDEQQDHS